MVYFMHLFFDASESIFLRLQITIIVCKWINNLGKLSSLASHFRFNKYHCMIYLIVIWNVGNWSKQYAISLFRLATAQRNNHKWWLLFSPPRKTSLFSGVHGIYNFNFKDIKNIIWIWNFFHLLNKVVYSLLSYYYHKSNLSKLIWEESGIHY